MNSLKEKKSGIVSQNENIRRGSVLCIPIIGACPSGHITADKREIEDFPKFRQVGLLLSVKCCAPLIYFLHMEYEKMPWSKESSFEKRKKELEEQGFTFAGLESLTEIKFDKEAARFITVPSRTKEDVIQEYIDKYKDQVDIEVQLVDKGGLTERQQAVYVFIKPKK